VFFGTVVIRCTETFLSPCMYVCMYVESRQGCYVALAGWRNAGDEIVSLKCCWEHRLSSICEYPRIHALSLAVRRRALNHSHVPNTPSWWLFVQHSPCNVLHNFWVSLTTYHYSGVELWPWLCGWVFLISGRSLQRKHVDHLKNVTVIFDWSAKLALTSPTGGGRSVGIVRSRTKAMEFSLV
jgi:hypothetical protein